MNGNVLITQLTLGFTIAATGMDLGVRPPDSTRIPAETDAGGGGRGGGTDMAQVAEKLNNPVASLISVPLQNNFDFGGGPNGDGFRYQLNLQPVIPVTLNEEWKVISRTILPFIHQDDMLGTGSQTGLGDLTQSFFFSPRAEHPGRPIWGLGPVLLFPTATDDWLGTEKWGAGPTGLLLWQLHGWTCGALVNHLWSFAGDSGRDSVNSTFLQPFLAYTTRKSSTIGVNLESTYDWSHEQWTVPFNLMLSQVLKVGKMPVSIQLGGRVYAEAPTDGPEWGLRASVTLVFPE